MQETCAQCRHAKKGVVIQVPAPAMIEQLRTSLSVQKNHHWQQLDSHILWCEWQFFFDCVPHWSQLFDLPSWQYFIATRLDENTVDIGEQCDWHQLIEQNHTKENP